MQVAMIRRAVPAAYMATRSALDGDTLVVETTASRTCSGRYRWHSGLKNAKLTMRMRKVKSDHWFLEVNSRWMNPTYYTHPV